MVFSNKVRVSHNYVNQSAPVRKSTCSSFLSSPVFTALVILLILSVLITTIVVPVVLIKTSNQSLSVSPTTNVVNETTSTFSTTLTSTTNNMTMTITTSTTSSTTTKLTTATTTTRKTTATTTTVSTTSEPTIAPSTTTTIIQTSTTPLTEENNNSVTINRIDTSESEAPLVLFETTATMMFSELNETNTALMDTTLLMSTENMDNAYTERELSTTTTTTVKTSTVTTTTTTMVPPNLLKNPGAEAGNIAGWTQLGPAAAIVDSGGKFNKDYYPRTGTFCFAGGYGANGDISALSQNVPLLGGIQGFTETQLDSGRLVARVEFHYQTWNNFFMRYDQVEVIITFRSVTYAEIQTVSSGGLTCSTNPGWCPYSKNLPLPKGTRRLLIFSQFPSKMSVNPPTGGNNAIVLPIFDKIRLSDLLRAAVQKTYHELYTMADVLVHKSALERKIELVGFVYRTRQLFIRILAIVKWVATTGRVTACEDIQNFLEIRAQLIRHTSDTLALLARGKLLEARVPNFPVTDAIDVLTLGTVNFLPKRIAEVTTTFTPATEKERQKILPRLQQILMARISTSELPIQFTDVIIKNGMVTLSVEGEFEVRLGVANDNLSSPWYIYQTKLFLRDSEEPEQELIHPMQMQVMTNFIQNLLYESDKPLVDLYQRLHYYCQALRLQILFEQAHRIGNQAGKQRELVISKYVPCKSFSVEYWKDYSTNTLNNNTQSRKQVANGKAIDIGMTIICDDEGKFQIQHWPPLPVDDSIAIMNILQKPVFTMEEILNRTIYARCQRRFEELRETLLPAAMSIKIDASIPVLICDFLPESTSDERLFISISPYSGLYRAASYMETRFSKQIESALNNNPNNLTEPINSFKIWLIQQRVPPLLAHLNCRIYTRIPTLNQKNELIVAFINKTVAIELIHHEGFYILIYVSNVEQLLLEYYLLIVEKRLSTHEPLVLQQQISNQQPKPNDEEIKWTLEPLVLCPLDPTMFLRKELFEFKHLFQHSKKTNDDDHDDLGMIRTQAVSVSSLKSLVKFVNYYDEMLSFIFLKDDFQRKNASCKNLLYCSWTGIPYLTITRISMNNESDSSNVDLIGYVNEYFWPRIQSSTIRMNYTLYDSSKEKTSVDQLWITNLTFFNNNYFRNAFIKTPYNLLFTFLHPTRKLYSNIVDFVLHEFRKTFELTYLFEDYSSALLESVEFHAISKLVLFNFSQCVFNYGPDFAFSVTIAFNSKQTELASEKIFDFRFETKKTTFLATAHRILNRKLLLFLNQTQSLKQLLRLLYMTAIPISAIARLNCFNRPITYAHQGGCVQPLLTLIPYTESRWRLIFGQVFTLDIQICGPDLILVRDGSFSVQLNSSLSDLSPIPRLKEFLSSYADDHGLALEFSNITDGFHEKDLVSPDMQITLPPLTTANQNGNDSTAYNSLMDTTNEPPVSSPSDIYDAIFRDSLPVTSAIATSNNQKEHSGDQQTSISYSYNHELLTQPNYPVYMSQKTFFRMIYTPDGRCWSRLESFLAASILVRQFSRGVTEPVDANNTTIQSVPNEQDTYRIERLSLQISFVFDSFTNIYRIRLISIFDPALPIQQSSNIFWSPNELENMETFLNETFFPVSPYTNITTPPIDILSLQASQNLSTAMGSFHRMLTLIQPRTLKDLVKIIELEQSPESHDHFWRAHWCLAIPSGCGFSQVGQPGIYYQPNRSHFLFVFRFTSRLNPNDSSLANNQHTSTFVVPLIYDMANNQTNLWDGSSSKHPTIGHELKYQTITKLLTALKETLDRNECSLYPTILELVTRLQVPAASNNSSS
ncbi:unnamed protein product [Adineta ricciae]|uniref:Mediator of RNA polymerase II transcription subunit 14 n=2 Tax=Adineta ricciae TaxID=249248 RepID=A0A813PBD4_ADIRI|nr:unnamed protein product [Adineta ricciae]